MGHQARQSEQSTKIDQVSISSIYEALIQDGFRPDIDEDSDIKFKWEGRWYYLRFEDDDSAFLRLCAINVAPSLEDMDLAFKFCNIVNSDVKVAKAFVIERQGKPVVWVNAECRYTSTAEFMGQFIDLLGGIRAGVNLFRDAMSASKSALNSEEARTNTLLN